MNGNKSFANSSGLLLALVLLAGLLIAGCVTSGNASPTPTITPSPNPSQGYSNIDGFDIRLLSTAPGTQVNDPKITFTDATHFELTFDVAFEADCPQGYAVTSAAVTRTVPAQLFVTVKEFNNGILRPCLNTPSIKTFKLTGVTSGATSSIKVSFEDQAGQTKQVAFVTIPQGGGNNGGGMGLPQKVKNPLELETVNDSGLKPNDAFIRVLTPTSIELTAAMWSPTACYYTSAFWNSTIGEVDVNFEYNQPKGIMCAQVLTAQTYRTTLDLTTAIWVYPIRAMKIFNRGELVKEISFDGMFCGGIAAFQCPFGFYCKLNGNYPDAGGKCVFNQTVYDGPRPA